MTAWRRNGNSYYPEKIHDVAVDREGTEFTKEYELLKVVDSPKGGITVPLIEGALIKDDDANIVYSVRNGQLVPNPLFNNAVSAETTWRRVIFLIAVSVFLFWVVARATVRRGRKRASI